MQRDSSWMLNGPVGPTKVLNMAPKLRKQADDSQIGPELEGISQVESEKGVNKQEGLPIGPGVQSPRPMLGLGRTPHVHYRSARVV